MFDYDFNPVLRFMVVSDVHYKDEHTIERDRMVSAIRTAYRLSDNDKYNKLDAIYVVGDFANSGSPEQMKAFRKTLDDEVRSDTVWNVSFASHEVSYDDYEHTAERFKAYFDAEPNTHRVINGFHFISVSCTRRCEFTEEHKEFAEKELKFAAEDDRRKPIFFFQHPHIKDTVYGSIDWGEQGLTPILCNYPQIIDFSGHSHAPINDPRSVHQRHFTCFGTGTLSYFEGDDFDKYYDTVFPNAHNAAQMLIVETDADNRVRVYPYDLITDNFFPFVWKIDKPWDPLSFEYTDKRYKSDVTPYFKENSSIDVCLDRNSVMVKFEQALIDEEYVCDYNVYVKNSDNLIVANKNLWSDYYFYDMPEFLEVSFDDLTPGEYFIEIYANSFWCSKSEPLVSKKFKIC